MPELCVSRRYSRVLQYSPRSRSRVGDGRNNDKRSGTASVNYGDVMTIAGERARHA